MYHQQLNPQLAQQLTQEFKQRLNMHKQWIVIPIEQAIPFVDIITEPTLLETNYISFNPSPQTITISPTAHSNVLDEYASTINVNNLLYNTNESKTSIGHGKQP